MDVTDNTVALVAKHCGLQLELYQKCVTQNPANWDIKCITQKRALAKCSEDKCAPPSMLWRLVAASTNCVFPDPASVHVLNARCTFFCSEQQ
jgi:hypothetical protein